MKLIYDITCQYFDGLYRYELENAIVPFRDKVSDVMGEKFETKIVHDYNNSLCGICYTGDNDSMIQLSLKKINEQYDTQYVRYIKGRICWLYNYKATGKDYERITMDGDDTMPKKFMKACGKKYFHELSEAELVMFKFNVDMIDEVYF
jgi:hypothetical protein